MFCTQLTSWLIESKRPAFFKEGEWSFHSVRTIPGIWTAQNGVFLNDDDGDDDVHERESLFPHGLPRLFEIPDVYDTSILKCLVHGGLMYLPTICPPHKEPLEVLLLIFGDREIILWLAREKHAFPIYSQQMTSACMLPLPKYIRKLLWLITPLCHGSEKINYPPN